MGMTKSLGYWIRRQRKALDMTQQGLSDRVVVSLAAIKKIEPDERRPSRQIAERMAVVLGISEGQRATFIACARGLRAVDQLFWVDEPTISASTLPTGLVTLLFTDIEGSTKLSQGYPDALPALFARHKEILKQAVTAQDGQQSFKLSVTSYSICLSYGQRCAESRRGSTTITQSGEMVTRVDQSAYGDSCRRSAPGSGHLHTRSLFRLSNPGLDSAHHVCRTLVDRFLSLR